MSNQLIRTMYSGATNSPDTSSDMMSKSDAIASRMRDLLDGNSSDPFTALQPRSVRFGSYKYQNTTKIVFEPKTVLITVPIMGENEQTISMKLEESDIVEFKAFFGANVPAIFIVVSSSCCAIIRTSLQMSNDSGFRLDSSSKDESVRLITILPEKIAESQQSNLRRLFHGILAEIDETSANIILVKSAPKEPVQRMTSQQPQISTEKAAVSASSLVSSSQPVNPKYCQYPPTGTDSITIHAGDYSCLEAGNFLNDTIITFFLKWFLTDQMSEADRAQTHIFTTFFYNRLTTRLKRGKKPHPVEDNNDLSAAQKRYSRVKRWTKHVDIFKKQFLVVPINENQHWYVAIVCFPSLEGPQNLQTGDSCDVPARQKIATEIMTKKKSKKDQNGIEDGPAFNLRNTPTLNSLVDEDPDRDEASGDDDDVFDEDEVKKKVKKNPTLSCPPNLLESPNVDENSNSGNGLGKMDLSDIKPEAEEGKHVPIRQPCILIFDSMRLGTQHSRVFQTLREYLSCEYEAKMGQARDFTVDSMPACCPKVPLQPNFIDCGLFVLQYVESFFKAPLADFCLPVTGLKKWFPLEEVRQKREKIANLIRRFAESQNPVRKWTIPNQKFYLDEESGYTDAESDSDEQWNFKLLLNSLANKKTGLTVTPVQSASQPMTQQGDAATAQTGKIVFVKKDRPGPNIVDDTTKKVLVPRFSTLESGRKRVVAVVPEEIQTSLKRPLTASISTHDAKSKSLSSKKSRSCD